MTIKSMRYGVSYKGSKNGIAKWVVDALPKAKHFYDLFAGGCAVTHAALLSGKYELFYANDIDVAPQLFLDAINGKYRNETRWISREDFAALKDSDPYVRYCWSFGNDGRSYLYSKEIEDYKKALHEAIFFKDYERGKKYGFDFSTIDGVEGIHERRIALRTLVFQKMTDAGLLEKRGSHSYFKNGAGWQCIEQLQSLQSLARLQSLERLERLQSLQSLERLQSLQSLSVTQKDYREIAIAKDSVIYADIPYKNTNGYGKTEKTSDFDYEAFYSWCEKQTELVVISEYEMPADRFIRVAFTQKRQRLNGKGAGQLKEEGLFIPRGQVELYNAMARGVSLAEEKAQGRLFDCA